MYAVHYFFSKLQITGIASTILYFGYMMIMVFSFLQAQLGFFFSCFWFVTKIYVESGLKNVSPVAFRHITLAFEYLYLYEHLNRYVCMHPITCFKCISIEKKKRWENWK